MENENGNGSSVALDVTDAFQAVLDTVCKLEQQIIEQAKFIRQQNELIGKIVFVLRIHQSDLEIIAKAAGITIRNPEIPPITVVN